MDAYNCPNQVTSKLPPYHRVIVTNAMRSGRYGNVSEFFRECIKYNGLRRGFDPATASLSPRARPWDNIPDHEIYPPGEQTTSRTLKRRGSPAPTAAKQVSGGTANSIGTVSEEKRIPEGGAA